MTDELLRDVPLSEGTEIPILGVRTTFFASDTRLLDVVEVAFGAWRSVASELLSEERVRVRLWLHDPPGRGESTGPMAYRMPSPEHLLVMGRGSFGSADGARSEVVGYVSEELLGDPLALSESFVQALTYSVVVQPPRHPFHAAGVVGGDSAVLLYGEGGTGKSTLTWACAERGLEILSEDVVYLQVEPDIRVWGYPGPVRLPLTSARFFPDVDEAGPTLVAGGREKLVLDRAGSIWRPAVRSATVCLLERGGAAPVLERLDGSELLRRLGDPAEPGFDRFPLGPTLEALVGEGGWVLRLGPDPHAAAGVVTELLERVGYPT